MDNNLMEIVTRRIHRTVSALKENGFDAHYIDSSEALFKKIGDYLRDGDSWSVGGSVTLFETGVIDHLKKGPYTYFDRYASGADLNDVYLKAKSCDVYFMSSNAITENGELYNVDGRGNRVSALIHGPKKVVIVAGYNKIVKTLDDARQRVWDIAAPANGVRLGTSDIDTMCSFELVCRLQTVKDRIAVLILPEQCGY
ncbi:MAG: lactate utilization protein [Oscillospiraceae bacterium]|jgi:L-lactate utilization protein LutB|nr:lactate utilization protein [Oscillospiraceae bacterium]